MKTLYKKRLLKLAAHLRSGKLAHDKFDYSVINSGKIKKNGCGTAGCALGECPAIFKEWKWSQNTSDGYGSVQLKRNSSLNSFEDAATFFDIDTIDADELFDPICNNLGADADAVTVAKHIEKFVKGQA